MKTVAPWSQRVWQGFCRRMTGVFYRHPEVSGLEHLPESGPVLLAANHVNALADAVKDEVERLVLESTESLSYRDSSNTQVPKEKARL